MKLKIQLSKVGRKAKLGVTGMATDMSYESVERELEAMHEFIEDNYDPDYGWIDQWEEENKKYLLDKWIQETEEAGLR